MPLYKKAKKLAYILLADLTSSKNFSVTSITTSITHSVA